MLYDPKWEKTTKADPVTLEGVIAWLETMPATERYPFADCMGACLYSQYLTHIGHPATGCVAFYPEPLFSLWEKLHEGLFYDIARTEPWTYGAALDRARKSLSVGKGAEK